MFTKTHLDHTCSNENLILDGLSQILFKDRNCFGGCVMIYLSDQIRATRRPEFEPTDVECLWIEIYNHTYKYRFYIEKHLVIFFLDKHEVLDIISILPVNKAIGPDLVSHKIL